MPEVRTLIRWSAKWESGTSNLPRNCPLPRMAGVITTQLAFVFWPHQILISQIPSESQAGLSFAFSISFANTQICINCSVEREIKTLNKQSRYYISELALPSFLFKDGKHNPDDPFDGVFFSEFAIRVSLSILGLLLTLIC